MNEEYKQLLITDLCGRLPYGVIFQFGGKEYHLLENINYSKDDGFVLLNGLPFSDCKPYLRPLNTITKSEIAAAIKYICDTDNVVWSSGTDGVGFYFYKSDGIKRRFDEFNFKLGCYGSKNIDWLNEHHFDYRGLIEKGLALEAPEGMYKN